MFLVIISAALVIVYGTAMGLVVIGVRRAGRVGDLGPRQRTVAIHVAARNEEARIGECIRAILAQTHRKFELVVVDDRSTDATFQVAQRASAGDPRATVLRIPQDERGGKKRALIKAIEASKSDILAFTDADCVPEARWLESLRNAFDHETVLVAGYSPLKPRSGLFEQLVALESAANAVTAAAMIGLGTPLMCTARSLAYTRSAYQTAGGLESVLDIASGDDTLMLQRIARLKAGAIRYLFESGAQVLTAPASGASQLLLQKLRHLSTVSRYTAQSLVVAVVLRSLDVLVVVGTPLALFGLIGPAPIWAWIAKMALDLGGLWVGLGRLRERPLLVVYPLLAVLQPPLILLASLLASVRRPSWR